MQRFTLLILLSPLLLSTTVAFADPPPAKAQQTIRSIEIKLNNIFEGDNLSTPYEVINDLKIPTREFVVKQELLFKVGDTYDPFIIEESARQLRELRFVRNASITALPDGTFVDIIVQVQDTWTLFPDVTLSLGGGSDRTGFGLRESNQLGFEDDEGRERFEGVYDDRRFLGSKKRLQLGHFQRSDGFRSVTLFGEQFRSLVQENAWTVNTDFSDLVGRLFEANEERFIYRKRHSEAGFRYAWSFGDPEEQVHRVTLGYEYLEDSFQEADAEDFKDADVEIGSTNQDPSQLADDRTFSGPTVAYELIHPEFISLNYVDRFERIEDFSLGRDFSVKLQFAGEAFASEGDTLLSFANINDGWRLGPTSFLRAEFGLSSRLDNIGFRNTLARAEMKYVNVLGAKHWNGVYLGKHTLIGAVSLDYGNELDKDREFLLGAGMGLRGYEARTFSGDKRFVVNLEERFHLFEDVLKLLNIGGAIFADAGGTTDGALGTLFEDNFYSSIGFGFRFGSTRSSGGGVIRVDIAFPTRDSIDGTEAWEPQILFSTGHEITARLRSESVGPERANVEIGTGQ